MVYIIIKVIQLLGGPSWFMKIQYYIIFEVNGHFASVIFKFLFSSHKTVLKVWPVSKCTFCLVRMTARFHQFNLIYVHFDFDWNQDRNERSILTMIFEAIHKSVIFPAFGYNSRVNIISNQIEILLATFLFRYHMIHHMTISYAAYAPIAYL